MSKDLELIDTPPSREERNIMHWYWQEAGGHTHVRVFMNGGKAGDLCFTNGEFKQIRNEACNIRFHEEQ